MCQRCFFVICGVVGLLGLAANANEKPTDEYVKAMRSLEIIAQGLEKAIEAQDHQTMDKYVISARPALSVIEKYWLEKEVEDAIKAIQAASKSIAEISVTVHLMSTGSYPLAKEGAQVAAKNFLAACATCHAAHREELPDGSYLIK